MLYYRDGALVSQAFDADAEKTIGDAKVVVDHVDYTLASYYADFKVSANGHTLVFSSPRSGSKLRWFNRSGDEIGTVQADGQMIQPRISPAGDRVAFSRPDDATGTREVWYAELARGIVYKLTAEKGNNWHLCGRPTAAN